MTPLEHEHATMVHNLAKPGQAIIDSMTPENAHLWHMASALMAEAGELFDAVKKKVIYNKGEIDTVNVIEELGDMEFYMQGLRQGLHISRSSTLMQNMEKLLKGKNARYASGTYSDQQALTRADKA